jgi:hypothetical protein
MPNWKKVIVSGSDASLNSLNVVNGITGSLLGTSSYASNGGVTQLLAGPNVTLSPTNGLGQVTVSSTSGGGGFNTATGSYGSFYDTTTQTNPVANIPRSMSFNTTDITNGVSISGSTSPFNTYIKTENPGVYDIQFSAQIDKTDSGADEIVIWLAKNGTALTDTATTLTLTGNSDKQVAAWNWFVNSAANDYYQIIWYSADTDLRILSETAGGGHPGIPSVIVTANRIDQFLSNTGSFTGSFTGQFTGSLQGTASYATQALSASFATTSNTANTASYVLNAISSSYASNADLLDGLNSTVFATTGSNTFIGNQTITGSVNISQSLSTPLINVISGSLNEGIIDINNSINSWIYSGKSFSIGGQETAPVGIFFKSDGTKMYINGSSGDDINEYNLGTPWDVTTAVFSTLFSTAGQDTAASDLFFSSDGTRLYVAGDTNNTIFQYSLGTAWDISTTSYSSISFSVAAKDTNPSGIFFKSDGTKMYVCGTSSDSVHEYDLGTAWNVSTATFLQSFSLSSQDTVPASINFNNDGTKFYIVGSTNDNIYEYNLGTPWNISTAVYYGRSYIGNQEATPTGLYVTTNNVYVVGSTSDTVFQYYSNTNALRLTSDSLILNTELVTTTGSISIDQNLDVLGKTNLVGATTAGSVTTSALTVNGTLSSTSTTTLASSTAAQTVALGAGATLAATTKTINIGTSGVSTSITNVNIGSAVAGALGAITLNHNTVVTGSLTVFSGSAIDFQVTDTGTKIGNLITDIHTITGSLNISGSVTATGFTGPLTGTASYATQALNSSTASYIVTANTASYVLQAVSSSFATNASTASYVLNAISSSYAANADLLDGLNSTVFAQTGSNTFTGAQIVSSSFTVFTGSAIEFQVTNTGTKHGNLITDIHTFTGSVGVSGSVTITGNQLITGSLTVGSSSLGASENTITLGARDTVNEGGQLGLNAPGGTYTSASFIDNWSNNIRILRGSNATSDGLVTQWNLHTKQMQLPAYTSATSFVGTATANLAVDSSGNVITVSTSGGTVFPYTGNAVITGSLTVTQPIYVPINGAMYFQGGDDAALYDVNIVNTMGIYGVQDITVGAVKLGSNGPVLYGSGSRLGLGTTTPLYALDINANTLTGARVYSGSLAVGNITPSATVGRIDASNDVVAFSTSDIRFKENITPIPNALDKLNKIGGYTFDWNPDPELTKLHGFKGHDIGVIAQEIEKVLPEVVTTRDNGYKAVKYEKLVALLIESNKELLKRIEVLESKINQ